MPEILVIPSAALQRPARPAVWAMHDLSCLQQAQWRERAACETDEAWLQLIPYVVLHNPAGQLWCYRRTGGDQRLQDRRSCGLGGHVEREDQAADIHHTLLQGAWRELREELADTSPIEELSASAWIYEGESAIGRVHLGLLYRGLWRAEQPPRIAEGEPMQGLGFLPPRQISADERFERWSQLAAAWFAPA